MVELEDLEPISEEDRSMGLNTYIPMWWSSLIVIQMFAVAFFAVHPHGVLNVYQAVLATFLGGGVILSTLFALNGFPGYRRGIPYAVQVRSSFGIRGAKLATLLRIIPAIAWLGIGNWIGALAINTISTTLLGVGNVWIFFVGFTILNAALALGGIHSIKWFDSIAAVIIVILMVYTVVTILRAEAIPADPFEVGGSWGRPFLGVVATSVAVVITGALNISDLSRHLKKKRGPWNNWIGHFVGIAPPIVFMMFIGILFGITTGVADPVEAMMDVAPTALVGTAMLIFVLGAQISTNLTLNILPPTHKFQDTFGISWKQGVIVTTILSILFAPWILFTADWFFTFMDFYAVWLGPIIGITLAEYWVVKKAEVDLDKLYDKSEGSPYWFKSGFSPAAIIALIIGALAALPFLDISWMLGLPVGFIAYIILKKMGVDEKLSS